MVNYHPIVHFLTFLLAASGTKQKFGLSAP